MSERLQEIKNVLHMNTYLKRPLMIKFDPDDVDWLIGQAEMFQSLTGHHDAALEENKRLREALEFYADADTYTDDRQHTSRGELVHTGYTKIQGDYGERARKALEETK